MHNITGMELRVKDSDTSPHEITFKITKKPKHGLLKIHTNDDLITSFTQGTKL